MVEDKYTIKLYKRRWVNLVLFMVYATNNGIHWVQYSVINDLIVDYYKIPTQYVEWSTGLYTLSYMIFVVPGLYLLEKIKFRYLVILVSLLSTIASWMKVFTVAPDRFVIALVAQTMIATSYTFTFGVSGRLIATWFAVHESSRAGALALFGDQFGGAVSFIVPGLIIRRHSDVTIFENSMKKMHLINASMSTVFLTLIILLFKSKPKNPPSMVQAVKVNAKKETFTYSFEKMAKNRAFQMFLFTYGINGGIMLAIGAKLGDIIATNFPDSKNDAGRIGFLVMIVGMFAAPVWSYILDKTSKFRIVANLLFTGTFISMILFTAALRMSILYVYISSFMMGIFVMSAYVNGIQIGIEILYPVSEDKCSAIMVFIIQVGGFIFIPLYGTLFRAYGDLWTNVCFCVLAFIGLLMSLVTPIKLNRQEAERAAMSKELKEFMPPSSLNN